MKTSFRKQKTPPDRSDRFQKAFTPLTKQPLELLEVVMKKPSVQIPYKHDKPPCHPPSDKFCKFHNDYRYVTNDCCNLKIAIENLIQEAKLLKYVRRESHNLKRRWEDKETEQS